MTTDPKIRHLKTASVACYVVPFGIISLVSSLAAFLKAMGRQHPFLILACSSLLKIAIWQRSNVIPKNTSIPA